MKINIVIGIDGSIAFAVGQGDFEQAKTAIQQVADELKLQGIEFESMGDVERHRHDHEHEHARTHVNA